MVKLNNKFLYSKPSVIGVLDSCTDEFNDIGSWLFDDSPGLLRKKFRESSLNELVIELVTIFREGNPNYQELAGLFGFVKIEKVELEEIEIWNLRNIERVDEDIIRIELHIDTQSLIINNLFIFVKELPPLRKLEGELNTNSIEIPFQELKNGFVITEKECLIKVLINSEENMTDI